MTSRRPQQRMRGARDAETPLRTPRALTPARVLRCQVPCQVLAMLLHYFFLSTFAWMLVEGLHLYSMVIKVFGSEDSKHLYYYGIGWGRWGRGGAGGVPRDATFSSYRPSSHLEETKAREPCWLIESKSLISVGNTSD